MKGFRTYPPLVWVGLVVLVGLSMLISDPMLTLFLYLGAAVLTWGRNVYLNPLGRQNNAYLQWLKTVPFSPGKHLPNGSPLPSWHDLVFIAVYCVAFARIDVEPFFLAALVVGAVCIFLGMFSLLVARQLLNIGPGWLGYVILIILLLSFSTFKLLGLQLYSAWVFLAPAIVVFLAFVCAVFGLKLMLDRYPWDDFNPAQSPLLNRQPLMELLQGHSGLQDFGQPMTCLNPKAQWPRLPSVHVWGLSLLAAVLDSVFLIYEPKMPGIMFVIITIPVTLARLGIYKGIRKFALPAWRVLPGFKKNIVHWNRKLIISIMVLIAMIYSWMVLILWIPKGVAAMLEPLVTLLVCYTAFRLPPSRAAYETTGITQVNLTFPANADVRRRSKPFQLP